MSYISIIYYTSRKGKYLDFEHRHFTSLDTILYYDHLEWSFSFECGSVRSMQISSKYSNFLPQTKYSQFAPQNIPQNCTKLRTSFQLSADRHNNTHIGLILDLHLQWWPFCMLVLVWFVTAQLSGVGLFLQV